ncbi:hypothetical protein ACD578_08090 [Microvirga sp. RSM25]|uniref:hypothetical protein n=1 Tax=Microvirga sp. RSM25 TaxID=3273802 RepID=UPI00384B8FD4
MQWSSVVIGHNSKYVSFVDVEQANAIELLLARGFWAELPLFSYAEFMIRAAEVFYDDGDLVLAAAMSERANARLRQYCAHTGSGLFIDRPKAVSQVLIDIMQAKVVLGFITGHEIGHILQKAFNPGAAPLFDWVCTCYEGSHLDKNGGIPRERFLLPEIIQKFDDDGQPNGHAIQMSKMVGLLHDMQRQQIKEAQSDALGVILASDAASTAGIPVDVLFSILFDALEYTEMLMVLRRLLPRLPRGEKRASVPLEGSGLVARQIMFVRLARSLRDGTAPAPEPIIQYWSKLSEKALARIESLIDNGKVEELSLRSEVTVRGGIELALYGKLAPHRAPEKLRTAYGIAAGGLIVAEAHRGCPEALFKIEESFDGTPESKLDGVLYGFGCAVRDICALKASETHATGSIRRADILKDGSDAAFVEFLRSARTQIFRMELNPHWAEDFKALLRSPRAE